MFQYWPDSRRVAREWNYQLYRLIAEAPYGGGDFGEIHRTASRIRVGNPEDWYKEWLLTAERVRALGGEAVSNGHPASARSHYLRAFNYYRSAEFFLPTNDPRRASVYRMAANCFAEAAKRLPVPAERILVPYENTELEGYFFSPSGDGDRPWPVVFFLSGADALPEENYFRGVSFITERGMACVCVSCPGQGSALRFQNLYARADYERPVSAVIDYLVSRPDLDSARIGLLGESMGGYYAPRAAAHDKRIRALVVCGGLFNVLTDLYEHYPPIQPRLQWILGAANPDEARAKLREFNLEDSIGRIECPMLITHGEEDALVPLQSAIRMKEKAQCPTELRIYSSEEGGAVHGQMDDRARNIPFMVDWLADRLRAVAGGVPSDAVNRRVARGSRSQEEGSSTALTRRTSFLSPG